MANHTPSEIDPQEIDRAKELWSGFTSIVKSSIIVVAATLLLLLVALAIFWR